MKIAASGQNKLHSWCGQPRRLDKLISSGPFQPVQIILIPPVPFQYTAGDMGAICQVQQPVPVKA